MKDNCLKFIFLFALFSICISCKSDDADNEKLASILVPLGDPFIILYNDTYYAYGTNAGNGIEVFVSTDLKSWKRPEGINQGLALYKDDVWADRKFWAPEVYYVKGKFYMYYSADEHICVATSDSPLGPFKQSVQKPMIEGEKCIDNSLFIDDNGKPYLFFVRFNDGNNIWVAELTDDLLNIKPETMHKCISVSQPWEEVWPRVNEGPFAIKHKGKYYLTYSANSFESPFYGIGCAIASDLMGKWKKYDWNPILQKPGDLVGVGHGAIFKDKKGLLRLVFHAHKDKNTIHPRTMYITTVNFKQKNGEEIISIDDNYIIPTLTVKK